MIYLHLCAILTTRRAVLECLKELDDEQVEIQAELESGNVETVPGLDWKPLRQMPGGFMQGHDYVYIVTRNSGYDVGETPRTGFISRGYDDAGNFEDDEGEPGDQVLIIETVSVVPVTRASKQPYDYRDQWVIETMQMVNWDDLKHAA